MAKKRVKTKKQKAKVITKKEEVLTSWMIWFAIALMVPTGAACYRVGQVSSNTSTLERVANKHEMNITLLLSKTAILQSEVKVKYPTIQLEIAGLKRQIGKLRRETNEHIRTMQAKCTTLHHDVVTSLNKVIFLSN